MGSAGTVAYSKSSDFDVWVYHHPGLKPAQIDELQKKASGIEAWCQQQLKLELHFFVFDGDSFRDGTNQSLSDESSGRPLLSSARRVLSLRPGSGWAVPCLVV